MVKKSENVFSPNSGDHFICDPSIFSIDFPEIDGVVDISTPNVIDIGCGTGWLFIPTCMKEQRCPIFYGDGFTVDIPTDSGCLAIIPKSSLDELILKSLSAFDIKDDGYHDRHGNVVIFVMELNTDINYRGLDIKSEDFTLLTGR